MKPSKRDIARHERAWRKHGAEMMLEGWHPCATHQGRVAQIWRNGVTVVLRRQLGSPDWYPLEVTS